MRKSQRYRYEMFVRVRDFGTGNRDLFPESSTGGQTFAQVGAAVAAIEEYLTSRDLARVEARRVKASTRAAVYEYMKTIAQTARQAIQDETGLSPFILPQQKTTEALLSKARLFIREVAPREKRFVALGLPDGFISEFAALVDQLHSAVNVKNNGRALRKKAQTGIEHALDQGFGVIKNLDVLVPNALRGDPVRLGHWRGARRLEGLPSSSGKVSPPVPKPAPSAEPDQQPAAPATAPIEPASAPAAHESAAGAPGPVPPGDGLRKAS